MIKKDNGGDDEDCEKDDRTIMILEVMRMMIRMTAMMLPSEH